MEMDTRKVWWHGIFIQEIAADGTRLEQRFEFGGSEEEVRGKMRDGDIELAIEHHEVPWSVHDLLEKAVQGGILTRAELNAYQGDLVELGIDLYQRRLKLP